MGPRAPSSGWQERIVRVLSDATQDQVAKLGSFLDLVLSWNDKLDLTAARDADELVDLFLADAVVMARASEPGQRFVDVGSGAGAPGIPLALLLVDATFTLVEPRAKRVAFLRTVVGTLGLGHVKIVRARSEELEDKAYDVAISRATLPPAEWLREGKRLAKKRVWLLLAKAEPPQGIEVDRDIEYTWPLTGVSRRALAVRVER